MVLFVAIYSSALLSPLDLPFILRDPILMSRTPCPCPSPPPSIYWKLVLLAPPVHALTPSGQGDLSWIYSKFLSCKSDLGVPSLQQLGSIPSFLLSKSSLPMSCEGPERELHMAVYWVTCGLATLEEERRSKVTRGACALAMFVAAPTHNVSPEVLLYYT